MRMPRLKVNGKARRSAWLVVTGFFVSGTLSFAATASTNQTQASAAVPVVVRFSPGIPEIARMVEARVDPQVIKTYIKNSSVAYNPSAGELIALKERGIPEDILTALVERGGQVKAQARQAPPSGPAMPALKAPTPYAYPYHYAYPAYAGTYPSYSYGAYPYSYYGYPSGPLISFNNSYPTYINGYPVYSGYYIPGYGYFW